MAENAKRRPGEGGVAVQYDVDDAAETTSCRARRQATKLALDGSPAMSAPAVALAAAINREHQAALGAARSAIEHAIHLAARYDLALATRSLRDAVEAKLSAQRRLVAKLDEGAL